ncbi:MAG: hypothetical protein AB7K08_09265 [Microbacteriaceae bacterium]
MTAVLRIALALLAVNELVVGAWNQFAPESFYANFPTVDQTPPFSEHFARDFGGATLGIAVLLVIGAIRPRGIFPLPAGIAYTVFAVPHFVFHAGHLEHASAADAAFLIVGNGLAALLGVLVIVLSVLRMGRDRRALHDPALG